MSLRDKLRDLRTQPADRDLYEYFGIEPGDPFGISKDGVTLGAEVVPIDEARLLVAGPPIPIAPEPGRSLVIGDL